MHLLPQLAEVEREFPDELITIGVHSPKFPAERGDENLRNAVLREEIEHPVVNDARMDVWSSYGVRAWPTLMFLDPQGRVIGKHEGEAPAAALAEVVRQIVDEYDARGLIERAPLSTMQVMPRPHGPLVFPGKVLADAARDRLFIADSGQHRIVVTRLDGSQPRIIGSGEAGLLDGSAERARFNHPQGMALDPDRDRFYVADRRNHAIRRIDLSAGQVQTIAGTGRIGRAFIPHGPARTLDLRSPWDLTFRDGVLYVAMAGTHQLYALTTQTEELERYAGTGHEGIKDETRERAWLAQPSGITSDGERLYFADSETSAIRMANLMPHGQVRTIVGTGLFDFGDLDGIGDAVRLQHPLGVAVTDGVLYVADSYNHKIKRVYPDERRVESWLGNGEPGLTDGIGEAARFREPGGLSVAGGQLFIADTDNHAIRMADIATGVVTTVRIELPS